MDMDMESFSLAACMEYWSFRASEYMPLLCMQFSVKEVGRWVFELSAFVVRCHYGNGVGCGSMLLFWSH